ncbi:hypothetical protein PQX77_020006 [Marasmius sp. AFHP31]|nr:hypothetical protein PQX77_020006 [Marasmius sp. AFHP31]
MTAYYSFHQTFSADDMGELAVPISGVSSRGKVQISDVTDAEEEEENSILSMVEGLVDDTDLEEPLLSNKNLALTLYKSPIAFTGPTKVGRLDDLLILDINLRSAASFPEPELEYELQVYDKLPPTPSTTSPDTSSPTGLAALPTVSPLASTPSDITMINGSSTTIVSSPELMRPGETWGVDSTSSDERTRSSTVPFAPSRRDSESSVETRVEDNEDSGALTTFRVNQHWKLYNEAIASATHTRRGSIGSPSSTVDIQLEDTPVSSSPPSFVSSPQISPTATSPDLSEITFTTVDMLSTEEELQPPQPQHLARRGSHRDSVAMSSLVYCRLCGRDPCEDCTATLCGHIFCYGYLRF